MRLRAVNHFRTCTLSDTGRGLTQLYNNGFLTGSSTSSTSSRISSRNGRTCSRKGTAGRHNYWPHFDFAQPKPALCTTKTCTSCCFGVSTSPSSSKSPSPAWEEENSEAEVEAGLAKIHASTWGQATVQCCFPRCSARALASIKDRLSFAHCFRVHPSQVVHGLPGSTLQSPAATRHWGHEAW